MERNADFPYFNSIKVRLKHSDFASQVLAHLFQFHKGTIKTHNVGAFKVYINISIP